MEGNHVQGFHVETPKTTAKIIEYPCGSMDILASSKPIFGMGGWEAAGAEPPATPADRKLREAGKKSQGADMARSMRRARAKVRSIGLANNFQYFVTLTLDQRKIDRYDGAAITKALSGWCDNMVRRHGMAYVLVPERHKDGAFHFHGFICGNTVEAVDSGHKAHGQKVYNLPQWKLGFSTAIPLYGDYARAVAYVCKYIGKQDGERPLGRWYFSGGNLAFPKLSYADIDTRELVEMYPDCLELELPGSKLVIVHTKKEE